MKFTSPEKAEWKTVNFIRQGESFNYDYKLVLPEPLASWDVYDYWERERIDSMRDNLSHGETLYDVGTEQGWLNLVYARFVGPENMVLIEPTKEFWPNIKATWEKNFKSDPAYCYQGLFSNESTNLKLKKGWPESASGKLIDRNKYQYIHDNEGIDQIRLDDFANLTKIPDAITIDVEGAELHVLNGAYNTLKNYKPKVWVSIHPDMMERDYNVTKDQLLKYMTDLGYEPEYLATDHEEHWYFRP